LDYNYSLFSHQIFSRLFFRNNLLRRLLIGTYRIFTSERISILETRSDNKENIFLIFLNNRRFQMKVQQSLIALIIGFNSVSSWAQESHPQPKTLEINAQAPDFSLIGTDDKIHKLSDFSSAKVLVVVFSCNHCPTAQAYQDRLINICSTYGPKGVALVVISPNSSKSLNLWEQGWSDLGDELEDMKIRAHDKGYNFPYLYDGGDQKVAIAYGPVATPHAFVFDSNRRLQYVGCIDPSMENGKAETLRNALDALLAGEKIENPVTRVFGCSTKWAWKTEETNKLYKQWSELPVTIENIDAAGIKELIKNKSDKLRLLNVWASWCGPCVMEFPDFVTIDRIYRSRNFEFISINADKMSRKDNVLKFLQKNEASNKNFIFNSDNNTELVEAVDPEWTGALPYTLLIEQGGSIICRLQGPINMVEMRKMIVNNRYIDGVK
jgi:thiol-disulfide isomerase/thioredoxin